MNDDSSNVVSRDHDQDGDDNDNSETNSITDDNNNDQSVQSSRTSIPSSSRTISIPSSSRTTSVVSTARKSITNNSNSSNTSTTTSKTSNNNNNNNAKQKGINEKLSLIHENILNTLKQSNKISPIFINVKNESYWYIQRNKIGPKKHMALIVKYNDNKCEYETNIYKMKLRESDMEVYLYIDDYRFNGRDRWWIIVFCITIAIHVHIKYIHLYYI